ncbi:MAG: tetratricopeptide repeat protein [Chthoniobacteraceae bacterium]
MAVLALIAGAVGAGITWMLLPAKQMPTAPPRITRAAAPAEIPPSVADLSPDQAAVTLGNWHYDRQRWSAAREQYEAAIRLGLDTPDIRTDLGNCFRFLNEPLKAIEQYEISQREDPQHENSLFNLAALHAQALHNPVKARELLNEYLRRFPHTDGTARARQLLSEIDTSTVPPDTERLLRELATEHSGGSK